MRNGTRENPNAPILCGDKRAYMKPTLTREVHDILACGAPAVRVPTGISPGSEPMTRKKMVAVLQEFVGRFQHVCQDLDGKTDPADRRRIKAVNAIIQDIARTETRGARARTSEKP